MNAGESSLPLSTWLFAGASVVVVLFTVGLIYRGKTKTAAVVAEAPPVESSPPLKKQDVVPVHPLNITRKLLDARGRAAVWSKNAKLVGGRALIKDDRLEGPLTLEFGSATIGSERLVIRYDGDVATQSNTENKSLGVELPDPSCPLDIGFHQLQLTAAGNASTGSIAVIYAYSAKHDRPIWAFSKAEPKGEMAWTMDADNCALLRR